MDELPEIIGNLVRLGRKNVRNDWSRPMFIIDGKLQHTDNETLYVCLSHPNPYKFIADLCYGDRPPVFAKHVFISRANKCSILKS